MANNEPIIIEEKGFPKLKIFENHFEVKAIDFWNFRSFKYEDVMEIKHYNPNDTWWNRFINTTTWEGILFSDSDPWRLKVLLKNGGDWTYETSYRKNQKFREAVMLVNENIKKRGKEA